MSVRNTGLRHEYGQMPIDKGMIFRFFCWMVRVKKKQISFPETQTAYIKRSEDIDWWGTA